MELGCDATARIYKLMLNVGGGYLAADHNRPRNNGCGRIGFDSIVQRYDVETIQQLPFVFVNTFHLK